MSDLAIRRIVDVLFGNGRGGFQQPLSYPIGSGGTDTYGIPHFTAVADFRGNGEVVEADVGDVVLG